MGVVRLLVGTLKGAFLVRAPAARTTWQIAGPYLPGQAIYALAYDGRAGRRRIWASAASMHWGAVLVSRRTPCTLSVAGDRVTKYGEATWPSTLR